MRRFLVCSSTILLAACGGTTDSGGSGDNNGDNGNNGEPAVVIVTGNSEANNATPNNGAPNNGAPNNGTPNNGAPNNGTPNNGSTEMGLALLGDGAHSLDAVEFTEIAAGGGLRTPRDLAFHPSRTNELWVLNLEDNSTTVYDDVGTDDQALQIYAALGKDHFMARPAALAFGENGNFATAQEEDEKTQGDLTPADFMGPTLWTSDRSIYDGGHGGHLDMLHNSPNGAGIAWESGNKYWVFDGYHQSVTSYDFGNDHGPGGQDHSDGDVARFVEGEVGYVGDVPSHVEFNHDDNMLYIADTGNNRIATLDTTSGEAGQSVAPNYDGGRQYYMNGGVLETWVDGSDVMLEMPSGLEIHEGHVYVSDNTASRIVAIDMNGNLVDYIELADEVPEGGLMGMAFAEDGSLFFVDAVSSRVLRIAATDSTGTP